MNFKCPKCGTFSSKYGGVGCDNLDCNYENSFLRTLFITGNFFPFKLCSVILILQVILIVYILWNFIF